MWRAGTPAGSVAAWSSASISVACLLSLTGAADRVAAAGMTVICTLHSNSERASLRDLAKLLGGKLQGVKVVVSKADRDPFEVV